MVEQQRKGARRTMRRRTKLARKRVKKGSKVARNSLPSPKMASARRSRRGVLKRRHITGR